MRDIYGVSARRELDFGPDAPGTELMTIEPFRTVMGVEGIATHGPKGRFTVLPDGERFTVREAATARRIGTYTSKDYALGIACKRAGIEE